MLGFHLSALSLLSLNVWAMIKAHINNEPCGILNFAAKFLPEEYELIFEIEQGAGSVRLKGGKSTPHWPTFDDDDFDLIEQTMLRINWARKIEGLEEVLNI